MRGKLDFGKHERNRRRGGFIPNHIRAEYFSTLGVDEPLSDEDNDESPHAIG